MYNKNMSEKNNPPSLKEVVSEVARGSVRTGQIDTRKQQDTDSIINNTLGSAPFPRLKSTSFEGRNASRDQGLSRISSRINRTAQFGGGGFGGGGFGGGMNTAYTPPQFYRPQMTPIAFNTVTQRKEVYNQVDWWMRNESIIAAAILFYSRFPFSGWKLEGCTNYVREYFEKLIKKLEFTKWIPLIAQEYYAMGDSFVYAQIDCPFCHGSMKDETGQPCRHDGATWHSLYVHDPSSIEISNAFPGMPPQYYLLPTEEMKRVVMEKHPRDHYDAIPNDLKMIIAQGNPIPLHPSMITHFKHFPNAYAPFGNSLIKPLFPLLMYKDRLRQAQWLIAERHILPIKIVKLGSDKRFAGEADLAAVQEELAAVANDPFLTLVVPHDFELEFYGANGKILQITEEFAILEKEITNGLMLNQAILSGEGVSYANASIGLLVMARRLEEFRNIVAHWVEEKIFKPVSMWNGFEEEDEAGTTKYIYPKIKFDDLQLKDDTGKVQIVMQAVAQGFLPVQTLAEILDLDWDTQVERLRFEQSINIMQTSSVVGADMGTGFRGPMGADMSGGMAQQAGLPPLNMGGAAGSPPMGGAPGMPGAPTGAPGMPAHAKVYDPWTRVALEIPESYRTAQALSRNFYNEFNLGMNSDSVNQNSGTNVRTASESVSMYRTAHRISVEIFAESLDNPRYKNKSRKVKSAAHAGYLKTIKPVSGRGFDPNILPENEVRFIDFGEFVGLGVPMNRLAVREFFFDDKVEEINGARVITAQRKPKINLPKEYFTSIEQALYNIILEAGIPYAFYAQYGAGPDKKYKLDGAFPAIKLAFEADSESFHSHNDQIARDRERDQELMAQGWTIIRFTDKEINQKDREVLHVVQEVASKIMGQSNGSSIQL